MAKEENIIRINPNRKFFCTIGKEEMRLLKTLYLTRDTDGEWVWVFEREGDAELLQANQVAFGAFGAALSEKAGVTIEKAYHRTEGGARSLYYDYKKQKEEQARREREEQERREREEQERRERERRETFQAQDVYKELKPKGSTRKPKKGKVMKVLAPNTYAFLHGNLTRTQNIVMHKIINAFQPYIKKAIQNHELGIEGAELPEGGTMQIDFPLSDLSSRSEYKEVEQEIRQLMDLTLEFEVTEETGRQKLYINVFDSIKVPLEENRKVVKCKTAQTITKILCNPFLPEERYTNRIARGFFNYQSNVIELTNKNTQRIYLWLSSFKDAEQGSAVFSLSQIRDMLNIADQYSTWGNFKRVVLDGAKEELDRNAYRFDLTFTYNLIYNDRRSAGFPDAIRFNIIDNSKTEAYLKFRAAVERLTNTMMAVGVNQQQVEQCIKLIDNRNIKEALGVLDKIKNLLVSVDNPPAFMYKRLYTFLQEEVRNRRNNMFAELR